MDIETVTGSADKLWSRAQTAFDHVRESQSLIGIVFPTDATKASVEALRGIIEVQIPQWRETGLQIAAESEFLDNHARQDEWLRIGRNIEKNIDGYDGLGVDYTLGRITIDALQKTAEQVKDIPKSPTVWGILLAIGLVAAAIIVVKVKG